MSFLVWESTGEYPIKRLAGVDMDESRLLIAEDECQPREFELGANLRVNGLTVEIFHGSVSQADRRMIGYDALACLEVVEHLDPDVLEKFWEVVLGSLRPKLVIVSTPNAEFNVYFPQLKYGTPESIFRNDDHRFEWTRQEFQDWCTPAAEQYGYTVSFTGTGMLPKGDLTIGFCTQFAILKLKETQTTLPEEPVQECYKLVSRIEHPIYEIEHTQEEILEYLHDKIARIRPRPPRIDPDDEEECNYQNGHGNQDDEQVSEQPRTGSESATETEAKAEGDPNVTPQTEDELGVLALEDLWAGLDIRQRCKRRSTMIQILKTSSLVRVDMEHDMIRLDEDDEFWKEWERQYERDNPVYNPYARTATSDKGDDIDDDYEVDWCDDDSGQTMGEMPVEGNWGLPESHQASGEWNHEARRNWKHDDFGSVDSPWRSPSNQVNNPTDGTWGSP
ncbi:Small RNA 2'-O-methyltransferase [Modicella reniformis]|uniref:Small RNA 2'-O-methyltransferase n=1 Tax=Modicella reniformis TaxID=1440133 RepID=A0A9P6LSJ7_9FUNG|nr:Small RNA 2'-O-methyltransferase [Modicella reniformis]